MTAAPIRISGAVEGPTDEAVLRSLINCIGAETATIYGKKGKQHLREKISGYNEAARHAPWVIIIDLNHESTCAPKLRNDWLPNPAAQMCFRVAVREIEAWLLADRHAIAPFLSVPLSRIPQIPETLDDPKAFMIGLAARSRRRDITIDMVPRPGSGRNVGPAYASRLIEFVTTQNPGWRPTIAAQNSDSLARCIASLSRFVQEVN